MFAGEELARELWAQMGAEQQWYASHAGEHELDGFLIGLHWNAHSRVALRNASSHMHLIYNYRTGTEKGN
jgi:hypothetical protein